MGPSARMALPPAVTGESQGNFPTFLRSNAPEVKFSRLARRMHLRRAGERPQQQASPRKWRYENDSHSGSCNVHRILSYRLFLLETTRNPGWQPAIPTIASTAEPRDLTANMPE